MAETDISLLREFTRTRSEAAFAEIVRRHVNLVFSVALRKTGNSHDAEEISQAVFMLLARKANSLGPKVVLAGWLYHAARLTTSTFLRSSRRRAAREQEAFMQSLSEKPEPEVWMQLAPLLDDAMATLAENDRDAIVLRYFEGQSLSAVGAALGASENAAKMRVSRALEKLRKYFARRGVSLSVAAIAGAMTVNAASAAPTGVATMIAASALAAGPVSTSTLALVDQVLKKMAWAKLKLAGLAVCCTLVVFAVLLLPPRRADVALKVPPASSRLPSNVLPRDPAQSVLPSGYLLAELTPLPGFDSIRATSVNNRGQVVGWMDGSNGLVHAYLWQEGRVNDLGTFGAEKAIAGGINDLGEIVNVVLTNGQRRVFVLEKGTVTDLGVLDEFPKLGTEGKISYMPSVDINNLSQVTGKLVVGDGQRSFLFDQGQISYFGLRGDGRVSYAKAMNNRGQIAGQTIERDSRWGAFVWQDGQIIDLPTLNGPRASPNAINDQGTVVGWAIPPGGALDQAHAVIWEKGALEDFNAAEWKTSRAQSINSAGQIVGYATTSKNHSFAFLKQGQSLLDLNEIVRTNSGWHLFDADKINERGQILARGKRGAEIRTFLISPPQLAPIPLEEPVVASSPAQPPPQFLPFKLTSFEQVAGGGFRLAFVGTPGVQYEIEASTDLTTWTRLGQAANNQGQVEFIDQDAPKFALRFYRAIRAR